MNTIEFKPDSQSTAFSPGEIPTDDLQKNAMFREILPIVFHKMKNKLTPVLGYAQILQARSDDPFFVERLRKIERNTAELTDAFNILKEYFKPDPAPRRPGNINRLLEDMGPFWQKTANAEKVRIVLELDAAAPDLPINAGQIKILLRSMVDNALTALRARNDGDKEIRLAVSLLDDALLLVIRDNGGGISEEDLANIWTPFFSRFPEHAGLGLVVCERIIASHGASCRVTSTPGEFSRFEIRFPLAPGCDQDQKESVDPDHCSQA
jgi:signal transduction histidine kinase